MAAEPLDPFLDVRFEVLNGLDREQRRTDGEAYDDGHEEGRHVLQNVLQLSTSRAITGNDVR
jgi:hypothetical protein